MTQFTSKAIEESFIRLLNERPLDKITIKDIVDDCGISRNTFYYHFQDMVDLVEWMLIFQARQTIGGPEEPPSWQQALLGGRLYLRCPVRSGE